LLKHKTQAKFLVSIGLIHTGNAFDCLNPAMNHQFKAREIILREGQPDPGFWILESGVLQVIKGDKFITEIDEPGAIFGEMSDILHEPWSFSDILEKTRRLGAYLFWLQ
jgi:signal-transduction protein with cAMP-binding, CBS, and nucleotidyltransferase domain